MFKLGDHIRVSRSGGLYWHHGIPSATDKVVHFLKAPGREPVVAESSWQEFVGTELCAVELVSAAPEGERDKIVARARRRIGERGYHLLSKNCETLCRDIQTGNPRSEQAEAAIVIGAVVIGLGLLIAVGQQEQRPAA